MGAHFVTKSSCLKVTLFQIEFVEIKIPFEATNCETVE